MNGLKILPLASILCWAVFTSPVNSADEPWRVVLQDVNADVLDVSTDLSIAAVRDLQARHVFHVLDFQSSHVLLTVPMPGNIVSAAIGPKNAWFIVSTERQIFQIDQVTGEPRLLLNRCSGFLAVDAEGTHLAVLGHFGERDQDDENPSDDLDEAAPFSVSSKLGIYDLSRRKWLKRFTTGLAHNQVISFDGPVVVAFGVAVRENIKGDDRTAGVVRFDPAAGEPVVQWSKPTRNGKPKPGEGESSQPPAVIAAIQTARKEAEERIARTPVFSGLLTSGKPILRAYQYDRRMILTADQQQISLLLDRANGRCGILTLSREGAIAIQPTIDFSSSVVNLVDGRFLMQHRGEASTSVIDLKDLTHVWTIPLSRSDRRTDWVRFLDSGCLVYDEGRLAFYQPAQRESLWNYAPDEILSKELSVQPNQILISPDGRTLAMILHRDSPHLAVLLSCQTGEVIARLPKPENGGGPVVSASFSADGRQLGLIHNRKVQIFDWVSGKLVVYHPPRRDEAFRYISSTTSGWLLGGTVVSAILSREGNVGPAIPLKFIVRGREIDVAMRSAVLVESQSGAGGVVDPEAGKFLAAWTFGEDEHRERFGRPERAVVAFDDRLLARTAGNSELILMDLQTLSEIATVHILPHGSKLAWIAFTPDGYWDASPGAENALLMFQGKRRATTIEQEARRNGRLIRQRIASITSNK